MAERKLHLISNPAKQPALAIKVGKANDVFKDSLPSDIVGRIFDDVKETREMTCFLIARYHASTEHNAFIQCAATGATRAAGKKILRKLKGPGGAYFTNSHCAPLVVGNFDVNTLKDDLLQTARLLSVNQNVHLTMTDEKPIPFLVSPDPCWTPRSRSLSLVWIHATRHCDCSAVCQDWQHVVDNVYA